MSLPPAGFAPSGRAALAAVSRHRSAENSPQPAATTLAVQRRNVGGCMAAMVVGGETDEAAAQQVPLVEVGTNGWLFSVWDIVSRIDVEAQRANLRTLSEAISILQGAQIRVAILVIPSKKRMMRQFLPAGTRVAPEIAQRYSLTIAEAARAGAVAPDIDALFRVHLQRDAGRALFFKTDTHWTPVGAEIAAVETARVMRAQMPLPVSRTAGTNLGDLRPMNLAQGDLAQLVPPMGRPAYPAEVSMIRDIISPQGETTLIESDVHDTAIVGSSNMQPRFGFQPVLSNQLGRQVGLFWKPNNMGAYAILLDYLGSDAFKQQRPRALVWQFLEQEMAVSPNDQAWTRFAMPPNEFLSRLRRAVA